MSISITVSLFGSSANSVEKFFLRLYDFI